MSTPASRQGTPWTRLDLLAVLGIAILTAIVTLPALRGHLAAYQDNPVHLVEIRELARPGSGGWADFAYCGFPLHMLHSPLVYGGLALLTRWGAPLGALYDLLLALSLLAPALALYFVARRRLRPPWAFALATTIVLYRASLIGGAAALGGMFTFHLAGAAFVLVLDRLARRDRTLRDAVWLAALAGFIGLTHMFITIALVYLGAIHVAWSLWQGAERRRRLLHDLPALGLGVVAAAAYWMPNLLARTASRAEPESIFNLAIRVVSTHFPLPPPELGKLGRITFDPVFFADALPQLAVVVLALGGLRRALRDPDDAPRYGAVIAVLFLGLMFAERWTGLALLGPQNARLMWIARAGLLLAAMPLLCELAARVAPRRAWALVLAGAAAFALLSGRVVARQSIPPASPELAALEDLWSWLRAHRQPTWGRVFLQDTFAWGPGDRLARSHVLVRTGEVSGVDQLGAIYGATPYARDWMASNPDWLFGVDVRRPDLIDRVAASMERANATHLVLSNPALFARFEGDPRFLTRVRVGGRFLVLERRGAEGRWARALDGAGEVSLERLQPGRLRLEVAGTPRRIALAQAHHPFWRVDPPGGATLRADADGLMVVEPSGTQAQRLELTYQPPALPGQLSLAGVAGIAVLAAVDVLRRRRRRAPAALR
jgi:hypothetical protein